MALRLLLSFRRLDFWALACCWGISGGLPIGLKAWVMDRSFSQVRLVRVAYSWSATIVSGYCPNRLKWAWILSGNKLPSWNGSNWAWSRNANYPTISRSLISTIIWPTKRPVIRRPFLMMDCFELSKYFRYAVSNSSHGRISAIFTHRFYRSIWPEYGISSLKSGISFVYICSRFQVHGFWPSTVQSCALGSLVSPQPSSPILYSIPGFFNTKTPWVSTAYVNIVEADRRINIDICYPFPYVSSRSIQRLLKSVKTEIEVTFFDRSELSI